MPSRCGNARWRGRETVDGIDDRTEAAAVEDGIKARKRNSAAKTGIPLSRRICKGSKKYTAHGKLGATRRQ